MQISPTLSMPQVVTVVVANADLGRRNRQADGVVEVLAERIDTGSRRLSPSNPTPASSTLPVTFFQCSATERCTAMPPPSVIRSALKSISEKPGVFSSALNSVFTPLM